MRAPHAVTPANGPQHGAFVFAQSTQHPAYLIKRAREVAAVVGHHLRGVLLRQRLAIERLVNIAIVGRRRARLELQLHRAHRVGIFRRHIERRLELGERLGRVRGQRGIKCKGKSEVTREKGKRA